MKKNGIFSNFNGNNNINALLSMFMNNKNNDKTKSEDNNEAKNKTNGTDFPPAVPISSRYAELIEKHDALSKKIDIQNKIMDK